MCTAVTQCVPHCSQIVCLRGCSLVVVQVARYMWKGVEKGCYVIGSPDSGINMLIGSSLAASSDRYFPAWLEFLFAPLFVLLHMVIRRALQASTKKILAAAELQLPLSTANGSVKTAKDE